MSSIDYNILKKYEKHDLRNQNVSMQYQDLIADYILNINVDMLFVATAKYFQSVQHIIVNNIPYFDEKVIHLNQAVTHCLFS